MDRALRSNNTHSGFPDNHHRAVPYSWMSGGLWGSGPMGVPSQLRLHIPEPGTAGCQGKNSEQLLCFPSWASVGLWVPPTCGCHPACPSSFVSCCSLSVTWPFLGSSFSFVTFTFPLRLQLCYHLILEKWHSIEPELSHLTVFLREQPVLMKLQVFQMA